MNNYDVIVTGGLKEFEKIPALENFFTLAVQLSPDLPNHLEVQAISPGGAESPIVRFDRNGKSFTIGSRSPENSTTSTPSALSK